MAFWSYLFKPKRRSRTDRGDSYQDHEIEDPTKFINSKCAEHEFGEFKNDFKEGFEQHQEELQEKLNFKTQRAARGLIIMSFVATLFIWNREKNILKRSIFGLIIGGLLAALLFLLNSNIITIVQGRVQDGIGMTLSFKEVLSDTVTSCLTRKQILAENATLLKAEMSARLNP